MRTGLTVSREQDGIKFYGEISMSDIARLQLDNFDKALMDDCPIDAPAADTLLVIEMLFRRIGEQS